MKKLTQLFRSDADVAMLVARLLRIGVFSASIIALIGGVIYLLHFGSARPEYHVFNGAPEQYRHLQGIFTGLLSFDGMSIIQLGIVILLATPILRIFFSAIGFAVEKDYLYVFITLLVFSVILFGMVGGLKV